MSIRRLSVCLQLWRSANCNNPLFLYQVTQSELDLDTVKTILSEYRIHNADITLRYDATSDDLIDVVEGNRIYVPCIYLLNKIGKYQYSLGADQQN